jgi:hypothetical protein
VAASAPSELDGRRSDAARGPGDEHGLAGPHGGAGKHVLGSRVGARKRRELRIGERSRDPMSIDRGHADVVGECSRAIGAEVNVVGGWAGRTVRPTEHRLDDDALADARRVDGRAGCDDLPTGIRALDARKTEWRTRPARILARRGGKAGHTPGVGGSGGDGL